MSKVYFEKAAQFNPEIMDFVATIGRDVRSRGTVGGDAWTTTHNAITAREAAEQSGLGFTPEQIIWIGDMVLCQCNGSSFKQAMDRRDKKTSLSLDALIQSAAATTAEPTPKKK